jgi:hypothetical protein
MHGNRTTEILVPRRIAVFHQITGHGQRRRNIAYRLTLHG